MDAGQRKAKAQLKQLANKGETGNARILAREFVRSKKASQRLHASVAQLNSISMQLNHQLGAFSSSSIPCVCACTGTRCAGVLVEGEADGAQRRSRSPAIWRSRPRS